MECPFCTGKVPDHAKKCMHCGEWISQPATQLTPPTDERETCDGCGKKMIPRIITGPPLFRGQGSWTPVPKRSICPYCATTHKTFGSSDGEKLGVAVALIVFIVVAVLIASSWKSSTQAHDKAVSEFFKEREQRTQPAEPTR